MIFQIKNIWINIKIVKSIYLPMVITCLEEDLNVVSVKRHLLLDCRITRSIRNELHMPYDPSELLREHCPVTTLIKYLQRIGILDEI